MKERFESCLCCDAPRQQFKHFGSTHSEYPGQYAGKLCHWMICQQCGLVFMDPHPSQADYDRFYREAFWELYLPSDAERTHSFLRGEVARIEPQLREHLDPFLAGKAQFLDVGCGYGPALTTLREMYPGSHTVGIEPSDFAAENARDYEGHEVFCGGFFENDFKADRFDAVLLRDVLEHFVDPLAALRETWRLTREGGVVFILAPTLMMETFRPQQSDYGSFFSFVHPFNFSPKTLSALCEKAGWETVHSATLPERNDFYRFNSASQILVARKRPIAATQSTSGVPGEAARIQRAFRRAHLRGAPYYLSDWVLRRASYPPSMRSLMQRGVGRVRRRLRGVAVTAPREAGPSQTQPGGEGRATD